MDKRTYLIESIQAKAHLKKRWVFDAFGVVTRQTLETYGKEPFAYQLFLLTSDSDALGYYDPVERKVIALSQQAIPLLTFKEKMTVHPMELPNVKEEIQTTYGNVFLNAVLFCYPFHDKIPFQKGKIKIGPIESQVAKKLNRDPVGEEPKDPSVFYVSEHLKFQRALLYIDQFSVLASPSTSYKSQIPLPSVMALRDKLVKESGDKIQDPVVLAGIEKQLTDKMKEEYEGDPVMDAAISGKIFDVCLKKKYGIYGLEAGFGEQTVITRSLSEGYDPAMMPAYVNAARSASYSRGAQTAFGGVEVKRANRAFRSVNIVEDDCGSKEGVPYIVSNVLPLVGRYYIEPTSKKPVLITEEMSNSAMGTTLMIRSPLLCRTKGLHFCKTCCGTKLSMLPNGLHTVVSAIGSIFMNCFMSAMHGKVLSTQKYDFKARIQ